MNGTGRPVRTRRTLDGSLEVSSGGDLVDEGSSERPSFDGRHGGRAAVEPQEFDLERCRTWVDVYDRANVASDEAVRWHRPSQHHAFVLAWSAANRQGFDLVRQSASRSTSGRWTTWA